MYTVCLKQGPAPCAGMTQTDGLRNNCAQAGQIKPYHQSGMFAIGMHLGQGLDAGCAGVAAMAVQFAAVS